jgi:hypothetical protein
MGLSGQSRADTSRFCWGEQTDERFIRILTNEAHPARWCGIDSRGRSGMTDLDDEDDVPKPSPSKRWRTIALKTVRFVSPVISIGCAVTVGYFAHMAANQKPPADIAALAVSILKSSDASPEMREWAADAIGIQNDIGMPAKSIRQ